MWSTLEEELDAALDVHITGGLMVAETPARAAAPARQAGDRAGRRASRRTCSSGAELRAFAPYLADDLAGAVYCPDEGHANPLLAAPLFALRAVERGARRPHARGGDRDRVAPDGRARTASR